jgi:glutathione S-transferase
MARFIAIPFSPWSEKARWALDHHQIHYRYEEHFPLVGDLKLRLLLRKPTGRVTAPVLEDGGRWYTDSFDIAKYADEVGRGSRLIPDDKREVIAEWNRRSEVLLAAGRAMTMIPLQNPAASVRWLPPGVPDALKPVLAPVNAAFIKRFVRKYRMEEDAGSHERVVNEGFEHLTSALSGGKRYLLGNFSYADIAMAVTLQFVTPPSKRFMAAGPGGREGWTNKALAERFPELLAWRDALYEEHRKPRS